MRFENNFTISWDKLIIVGFMIGQLVYNVALMPQRVEADLTPRFASQKQVDMMCDRLDRLENKIDKLIELVQYK